MIYIFSLRPRIDGVALIRNLVKLSKYLYDTKSKHYTITQAGVISQRLILFEQFERGPIVGLQEACSSFRSIIAHA